MQERKLGDQRADAVKESDTYHGSRGGGVLPYMGYIGPCQGIGYGF